MVSSWITQRDPRWFEAPLEFRPERFLEPARWPRGAYFPFGLGDRACPGTAMAMIDLAAALAYWVEHWDIMHDGDLAPRGWFSLRPQRARGAFPPSRLSCLQPPAAKARRNSATTSSTCRSPSASSSGSAQPINRR